MALFSFDRNRYNANGNGNGKPQAEGVGSGSGLATMAAPPPIPSTGVTPERQQYLVQMRATMPEYSVPAAAFAQGGGRANRAPGDTTHVPAPFDATGWKTVWLDHITYQCTDYRKAAAFYSAVMGWKVRNDDGKRVVMDMGDVGGIIMTNGYVAPPPPPPPAAGNDSAGRGRGDQAVEDVGAH